MKFRRKPLVIEAEQFDEKSSELPKGAMRSPGDGVGGIYVVTAHGQHVSLQDGDWVIAEPDGRGYYPCIDAIFRATYEPVEEAECFDSNP